MPQLATTILTHQFDIDSIVHILAAPLVVGDLVRAANRFIPELGLSSGSNY